jgi:hypothetical protein
VSGFAREAGPAPGVQVHLVRARAHGFEVQVAQRDGSTYDVWVPRSVAERARAALLERADLLATSDGRGVHREVGVHVLALLCVYGEAAPELSFLGGPGGAWSKDPHEMTELPTERYSDVPTGSIDPPPEGLLNGARERLAIGAALDGGAATSPAADGAGVASWWLIPLVALAAFLIGVVGAVGFGVVHARP